MPKYIFYGGCHGCTQQTKNNWEQICYSCCYFDADWKKPNRNNKPPTKTELKKEEIKKRIENPTN